MCYNESMNRIRLIANAKLNLCLQVGALPAEGGLHPIDSLMHTIDWCDYITLTKRKDEESTCNPIEGVEDNLALRAARHFSAVFETNGVDIDIRKHIPIGGGFGGGSADAAAVLKGMATLYGVDYGALAPLAASLGSDVPFFLTGGFAKVSGKGEVVQPLEPLPLLYAVVIVGKQGMSTAEAFRLWDERTTKPAVLRMNDIEQALRNEQTTKLMTINSMQNVCAGALPCIKDALAALADPKALQVAMTGSGSGTFALYNSLSAAEEKQATLSDWESRICRLV